MPGRPKSEEEKRHDFVQTRDKWMDQAVSMYHRLHGELDTERGDSEEEEDEQEKHQKKSLQYVCEHMEKRCWIEDQMQINLNKTVESEGEEEEEEGDENEEMSD